MLEEMVLNDHTRNAILSYCQNPAGPVILYGDKGMGKHMVAERMADRFLNGNHRHPDFMEIVPQKGMIRVAQIAELHEFCNLKAVQAERKIAILDDACCMNENSQNAILKLLEDGSKEHIIILVAHQKLISTIESRCQKIFFLTPPSEKITEFISKGIGEASDAVYYLAQGRCGLIEYVNKNSILLKYADAFLKTVENLSNRTMILECMYAIKERDTNYVYDVLDSYELRLFLQMQRILCMEALYVHLGLEGNKYSNGMAKAYRMRELQMLVVKIEECLQLMKEKRFSRNDFFALLQAYVGGAGYVI